MKRLLLIAFSTLSINAIAQTNTFPSSGNVGIGTTTPTSRLEIFNTAQEGQLILSTNDNPSADQSRIDLDYKIANTNQTIGRISSAYLNSANGGSGALRLYTSNNGVLGEKMKIDYNGNVGIGTTNPSEKLTIGGGHTDTKLRFYSTGNGSDEPANLSLWASEPGWTYYGTGIGYNVNGSPYYGRIDNARGSSYLRFLPGETKFEFQNTSGNYINAVTLKEGGNVGIGTTNPAYKLDVLGTIRAKEVLVNLDGGADFVFEKGYKLLPIEHVANYVQENKHLPDIPSANEMVKNGVSMGDMQVKLLQKVEELTLYAIEMKKEINMLKEENKRIRNQLEQK
jgi:hypothetical protein